MAKGMKKDLKKLLEAAKAQGWAPRPKKSGEMWLSPDGVTKVMIHETPSDHRAFKNLVSEFRRGGLEW